MKLSERIQSISYFKANAAAVLDDLAEPWIITQNGSARAVVMDIAEYERQQETVALLKILALGRAEAQAGRVHAARNVLKNLREGTLSE